MVVAVEQPPSSDTGGASHPVFISQATTATVAQDTVVLAHTPPTGHLPSEASTSSPTPTTTASHSLPEDDGMGLLRGRIIAIQSRDLPPEEKAVLVHRLLMEGYNRSQARSGGGGGGGGGAEAAKLQLLRPESEYMWEQRALATGPLEPYKFWNHLGEGLGGLSLKVSLSEDDLRPTFVPPRLGEEGGEEEEGSGGGGARPFGCEHYRRNVKMQCVTCERWYTCRLCHDAVEDHQLPRKETVHMLCMVCNCAQKVGDACVKCGTAAARYYCGVCKLWNDDPDKSIYHCNDCGICRVGQGLGKDFFHCNKCMACIAVSISEKHKCIERSTDRDCPICGDNMFDSVKRVIFMDCGHTIHHSCFKELLKTSYRCPLCNKSVVNMEIQFRNYDAAIQNQPMPAEYRDARAVVSCNDCSAKSQTAYHWLGLRCSICQSYNTVALQLLDLPSNAPLPVPGSEVAALAVGAGAGAVSPSQGMDSLPSPPLAAVAPPTMTAGPPTPRAGDEGRGLRQQPQHLAALMTSGPRQPSLPHETSGSSMESASTGPAFSPDRMDASPPPLPLPVPGAGAVGPRAAESDDEDYDEEADGFWDGDVLGNILSSPGESDNDAGSRGPGSGDESGSGDDSGADGDEDEEDEDDEKEERLMLPGHR